jgi:hypothetical protein
LVSVSSIALRTLPPDQRGRNPNGDRIGIERDEAI